MGKLMLEREPIAIIGIGSLFPGAQNTQQFWNNIIGKKSSVTAVPEKYWDLSDYYNPDPFAKDATYSNVGCFIPEVTFSPMEFGIPPNSLETITTQQLLCLLVAKEAFLDAGLGGPNDKNPLREKTGVILASTLGSTGFSLKSRTDIPVIAKILKNCGVPQNVIDEATSRIEDNNVKWTENSFPGYLANIASGRIANRFNLGGTNFVVDAACASSFSAVKMAIAELRSGDCDVVLTGGANIDASALSYVSFSKTPALSPTGIARPFDEKSDGMIMGEGIGMVVLKRLADAHRDNDRIYAVIKDVGSSSDGRSKSIYAPDSRGQKRALHQAYQNAEVSPNRIGMLEAHGTGTAAGDVCEAKSLTEYYSNFNIDQSSIPIGSIKSQIGHTRMAAGMASLIKTALSLYYKVQPATLNVENPNPKLGFDGSPFFINTSLRPWIHNQKNLKRAAAVSSFGFGGANFHVVMEESDTVSLPSSYHKPQVIFCGGDTKDQLIHNLTQLEAGLEQEGPIYLKTFSKLFEPQSQAPCDHRLTMVIANICGIAETITMAKKQLKNSAAEQWDLPTGIYYSAKSWNVSDKVVALFPGQGSQYVRMANDFTANNHTIKETFATMDRLRGEHDLSPISKIVYPPSVFTNEEEKAQEHELRQTLNTQTALAAVSAGMLDFITSLGLKADIFLGHSFGEIVALYGAGAIDKSDMLSLALKRAIAMSCPGNAKDPGAMVATDLAEHELSERLKNYPDLTVANFNSDKQTIVSGDSGQVKDFSKRLKSEGRIGTILPVSKAFHSTYVASGAAQFTKDIKASEITKPKGIIYANATGKPYPSDTKKIKSTLSEQMLSPVHFKQAVESIYEQGGRVFVEIGPKKVLSSLVQSILGDRAHVVIPLNPGKGDSELQMQKAIAKLQAMGLPLKKEALDWSVLPPKEMKKDLEVILDGTQYTSKDAARKRDRALNEIWDNRLVEEEDKKAMVKKTVEARNKTPQKEAKQDKERLIMTAPPAKRDTNCENNDIIDLILQNQLETAITQQKFLDYQEQHLSLNRTAIESYAKLIEEVKGKPHIEPQVSDYGKKVERLQKAQDKNAEVHSQFLLSSRNLLLQMAGVPIVVDPIKENAHIKPAITSSQESRTKVSEQPVELGNLSTTYNDTPQTTATAISTKESTILKNKGIESLPTATPIGMNSFSFDENALKKKLLTIIGEKTGYPEDLLDEGMDFEADLGIDSIKRVEIFSELATTLSEEGITTDTSSNVAIVEELGQMKNITDIIEFFKSAVTSSVTNSSDGEQLSTPQENSNRDADKDIVTDINSTANIEFSSAALEAKFLGIISEKTGYPPELIESSMDFEADLGIDSIKKVEIFSELAKELPAQTNTNAQDNAEIIEELGQMKTIEEIIGFFAKFSESNKESTELADQTAKILPTLIKTVMEKTGYPEDLIDIEMDLEADLGIDSIKKVEIFASLETIIPKEIDVNPGKNAEMMESLGQLKNLKEIDEFLQKVVTDKLQALETKKAVPQRARPSRQDDALLSKIKRFEVEPITLPSLPTTFNPKNLPQGRILITEDNAGVAKALAGATAGLGMAVTSEVVTLPQGASETDIASWVDNLVKNTGKIHGFIHIADTPSSGKVSALTKTNDDIKVRQVFLIAKHLAPYLENSAQTSNRTLFACVTRLNGSLGFGQSQSASNQGGLLGLTKSLNIEWPNIHCRAVDIEPSLPSSAAAAAVLEEISHGDDVEVGRLTSGERTKLKPAQWDVKKFGSQGSVPTKDSIFVVSGGGRGITASCVIGMAKEFGCGFILLGRTDIETDEPSWAKGIENLNTLRAQAIAHLQKRANKTTPARVARLVGKVTSAREVKNTIKSIENAGGRSVYLATDITSNTAVAKAIALGEQKLGAVTSILHGAGNLADKKITKKTLADFNSVHDTKVLGLEAILTSLGDRKLKHLILFSSISGFWGNQGQTDYSLANEILNKFAHRYKIEHPHCLVRSFNWGPWDSGMVTTSIKSLYEKLDIDIIPVDVGVDILVEELRNSYVNGAIQILVSGHANNPMIGL